MSARRLAQDGYLAVCGLAAGLILVLTSVSSTIRAEHLPFTQPNDLVVIFGCDETSNRWGLVSLGTYFSIRERSDLFAGLALIDSGSKDLDLRVSTPGSDSSYARAVRIAPGTLETLGTEFLLGGDIKAGQSVPPEDAAVVSEDFWRTRLDSSGDVLNTIITVNGSPKEIVGVVADEARHVSQRRTGFADRADLWLVINRQTDLRLSGFLLVGRLAAGVSRETALQALESDRVLGQPACVEPLGRSPEQAAIEARIRSFAMPTLAVGALACLLTMSSIIGKVVARKDELDTKLVLGASPLRLAGESALLVLGPSLLATLVGGIVGATAIRLSATTLNLGVSEEGLVVSWASFAALMALIPLAISGIASGITLAYSLVASRSLVLESGRSVSPRVGAFVHGLIAAEFALVVALGVPALAMLADAVANRKHGHVDLSSTSYALLVNLNASSEQLTALLDDLEGRLKATAALASGAPHAPRFFTLGTNPDDPHGVTRLWPILGDYFGALGASEGRFRLSVGEVILSRAPTPVATAKHEDIWRFGDELLRVVATAPDLGDEICPRTERCAFVRFDLSQPSSPLLIVNSPVERSTVRSVVTEVLRATIPTAEMKDFVAASELEARDRRPRHALLLLLGVGLCSAGLASLAAAGLTIGIAIARRQQEMTMRVALGARLNHLLVGVARGPGTAILVGTLIGFFAAFGLAGWWSSAVTYVDFDWIFGVVGALLLGGTTLTGVALFAARDLRKLIAKPESGLLG